MVARRYAARNPTLPGTTQVAFSSTYANSSSGESSFWNAFNYMLIVFLLLAGLAWLSSVYVFMRERRSDQIDLELLGLVRSSSALFARWSIIHI